MSIKQKVSLIAVLVMVLLAGCQSKTAPTGKPVIFVSVLPQQYFVQQLVGDDFTVKALVPPGASPATYEPTPAQMSALANAELYFSIGVPFEHLWLPRIKQNNPNLYFVDTTAKITRQPMDTADHLFEHEEDHDAEHDNEHEGEHEGEHHHHGLDPHIWLSPALVKVQTQTMYRALVKLYPDRSGNYQKNLDTFSTKLDSLTAFIKTAAAQVSGKNFMVFHPSFGYLAHDLGLKQIPLEIEGKEPTPKQLTKMVDFARQHNISTVVVQKQFSLKAARSLADATGGKVLVLDPLAANWDTNLRQMVTQLTAALSNRR